LIIHIPRRNVNNKGCVHFVYPPTGPYTNNQYLPDLMQIGCVHFVYPPILRISRTPFIFNLCGPPDSAPAYALPAAGHCRLILHGGRDLQQFPGKIYPPGRE